MKTGHLILVLSSAFYAFGICAKEKVTTEKASPMLFDRPEMISSSLPNFNIVTGKFEPLDQSRLKEYKTATIDSWTHTYFTYQGEFKTAEGKVEPLNFHYSFGFNQYGENRIVGVDVSLNKFGTRDSFEFAYDKSNKLLSLGWFQDTTGKQKFSNAAVVVDHALCAMTLKERSLPKQCVDFIQKFNAQYVDSAKANRSRFLEDAKNFGREDIPDFAKLSLIQNIELIADVKTLCDRYGSFLSPEEQAPVAPAAETKTDATKVK